MMRAGALILLGIAAGAAALPARAATPDTANQHLQVTGDVPIRCKLSPPIAGTGSNTSFSQNSNGGELDLTALVDTTSAKTQAASGTIQFPIVCTGAHALTVSTRHGGLGNQNASGNSGGFTTHADYSLSATWAGTTKTFTTAGAPITLDLSQSNAASGNLSLDFSLSAGQGPLEAGTYSDDIVVDVNAQ